MREIRTSGSEEGSAEVTQQIYSNLLKTSYIAVPYSTISIARFNALPTPAVKISIRVPVITIPITHMIAPPLTLVIPAMSMMPTTVPMMPTTLPMMPAILVLLYLLLRCTGRKLQGRRACRSIEHYRKCGNNTG